jgi:putative zinc finger protein
MNCHEAREQFSDLIAGTTGLTESARVDAHVSQCAECRDLLEGLYRLRRRDDNREQGNATEVYVEPSPDPGDADDFGVEPPRARPWLRPVLIGAALIIVGIGVVFASSVSTWTPARLTALLTGVPRATAPDARPTVPTAATTPDTTTAPTAATTPDATTASGASTPREETANSREAAPAPSLSSPTPQSAAEAGSALKRTKQARVAASKPDATLGLAAPPRKASAAAKSEALSEGSSASGSRSGAVGQPSAQDRGEADRPGGTKHVGVVVTASPTHLTIDEMGPWLGPGTRPMRYVFQLTGTTKVARTERTKEGRNGWAWGFSEEQLRRTDLRPGDFVTVTARRSGDNAVAISVLAVRPNSRLEIPGSS